MEHSTWARVRNALGRVLARPERTPVHAGVFWQYSGVLWYVLRVLWGTLGYSGVFCEYSGVLWRVSGVLWGTLGCSAHLGYSGPPLPSMPPTGPTGRISQIDLFVITHRHSDHFGGAFRLIPDFPIKRCLIPRSPVQPKGFEWPALAATMASAGVTCLPVAAGYVAQGRGYNLEVLFPLENRDGLTTPPLANSSHRAPNENFYSLIARLQTSDGLIWVTGDSPSANEEKVMGTLPTNFLGGVLLVPHHGSTTSSSMTLLEQTKPHAAMVSHGKQIPVATTIKYRNQRIPLCGTYPSGTVQFRLLAGITLVPLACLWE
mgnify:CR=1 FL=1